MHTRDLLPWILAVLVGAIMLVSYTIVPLRLGGDYLGVVPMYYDDGNNYRARMQEVLDGHIFSVSSYLHEYKTAPVNVAPVGEWVYAIPAMIFGISVVQWMYFFLLPAGLFILVYLFVRELLEDDSLDSELTAIAAALLVLFGFEFVDFHYVLSVLQGGGPAAFVWTRPVNPIIGALQLFGMLILLRKLVDGERRYIFFVGALVATTIGYYFAWGMALSILGALFLIFMVRRDYSAACDIFYAGALSVALAIPYLYNAVSSFSGEAGTWASTRTGMFFTHEPVVNTVLLITTVVIAACFSFAYWRGATQEHRKTWIFIAALLIAGWVAFNEQVITGKQIWHHHFVQYTVPFSYCMIFTAGYLSFQRYIPQLWRLGVISVSFLMILHGLYSVAYLPGTRLEDFRIQQSYAPLLDWLNERAEYPCVIFPMENKIGQFINAYTHCDVYVSGEALYAVPKERVLHNYLLLLRLQGLTFEESTRYFLEHEGEVRGYLFDDWHQLFGRGIDGWFLKKTQDLTIAYALFMQEPLESQLRKYRVDFFVSREPLLESAIQQLPGLGTPQKIGDFYLYEFK